MTAFYYDADKIPALSGLKESEEVHNLSSHNFDNYTNKFEKSSLGSTNILEQNKNHIDLQGFKPTYINYANIKSNNLKVPRTDFKVQLINFNSCAFNFINKRVVGYKFIWTKMMNFHIGIFKVYQSSLP